MILIPFADKSYSKNILYRGQTELNAPVYKYGISYNPNTGDMIFTRGGKYNVSTGEISYPVNSDLCMYINRRHTFKILVF